MVAGLMFTYDQRLEGKMASMEDEIIKRAEASLTELEKWDEFTSMFGFN